jgi:hypothetical protein
VKTYFELKALIEGLPATTSALLQHDGQAFYRWQSERLGNELFISDPDRANRIWEAAEDGCDGSTHREHIQDFRDYAEELFRDAGSELWRGDLTDEQDQELESALEAKLEAFETDADRLEEWHKNNGSLDEQCG